MWNGFFIFICSSPADSFCSANGAFHFFVFKYQNHEDLIVYFFGHACGLFGIKKSNWQSRIFLEKIDQASLTMCQLALMIS